MLQTIREHTQGWITRAILAIVILSFALWGIHSYFSGTTDQRLVATVNNTKITKDQLNTAYERLRRQAQAQYGTVLSNQDALALKSKALQALTDIIVMKQASLKEGFRISDEQIDRYLESMPEFQVDGEFSLERFQSVIAATAISMSEFLELARTSLLIDQPRLGMLLTAFSLPGETNYTISLVNQERDINYMILPFSHVSAKTLSITQEAVAAYYTANQNEFMTPEEVSLDYILLSVDDLKKTIQPTDAMLFSYYNDNINAYTDPAAWKLATITLPIAENALHSDIEAVQQKANETVQALKTNTSLKGDFHDLNKGNWTTLNRLPTDLQQSVASLTMRGQISDPIQTEDGFVIVRVIDYLPPKTQALSAVKDKIRAAYIRSHAEEQFATLRDQLADLTYEHPDSLTAASNTLHLPILSSELFTQDKPGKGIAQYKKVREVAFSGDVLATQNNSDVIQITPETVVVLRVKSHIPSTLLALKNVSKQIEAKLARNEAQKRITTLADQILEQLQHGADPAIIAAKNQLSWVHAGMLGRYAIKVDPAILDRAFSLPHPDATRPVVYGNAQLADGYAIIALAKVKPGVAKDEKQSDVFAEQIEQSTGVLEYALYKQSQLSQAKIVKY